MTVFLLKMDKVFNEKVKDCQKAEIVILENGDIIPASRVCLSNGNVIIFSGDKVYKIKFDFKNTTIKEYDAKW